ncbi:MAG: hypothetical protein AB1445_01440 [Bacillota bacterium]
MHHHGGRISEMEKLQVQELLRNEELCVAKAEFFMNQTQDPSLRDLCRQCVNTGHRHINELNNILRGAGISPHPQ